MWDRCRHSIDGSFEKNVDIDVVIDHKTVAPILVGVKVIVGFDGPGEARDYESGEGRPLSSLGMVSTKDAPGVGDIDFYETVDDMFPTPEASGIDGETPIPGNRV